MDVSCWVYCNQFPGQKDETAFKRGRHETEIYARLRCQPPRPGPKGCSASDRGAVLRDEGTRPDSQWTEVEGYRRGRMRSRDPAHDLAPETGWSITSDASDRRHRTPGYAFQS